MGRGAEVNHKNDHRDITLMLVAEDGHVEPELFLAGELGPAHSMGLPYLGRLKFRKTKTSELLHGEGLKRSVSAVHIAITAPIFLNRMTTSIKRWIAPCQANAI